MFEEHYKAFARRLAGTDYHKVLEQLETIKDKQPELYAAFHMMALPLYAAILQSESDAGASLNRVPHAVIQSAIRLSWDFADPDWLCDKLQKWAMGAFLGGHRSEPGFNCG